VPARVIGKVPVPGHNRSSDVIRHVSIETISLKRVYDYNDNGRNQKRTAEVETTDMSSGDPQRTWFPEMIVRLRADWQAEMSMPALIVCGTTWRECFAGFELDTTSRRQSSLAAGAGSRDLPRSPTSACAP